MSDEFETPVTDAMTTPVKTVDAGTTASEVAGIMLEEGIGSVLIRDPSGIVTKTDLVAGIHGGGDLDETPVSALMSSPVLTVDSDDDVQEVIDRMEEHGIKRLVVDSEGGIVGIVTVTDLAETFAIDLDTIIGTFA
ncbi:MAG: CBS domain-containing protein [Halodesulfurarchaeum sp.]|nr:CBS domain-containing protein [Halodesulfurarchaeum sp.]